MSQSFRLKRFTNVAVLKRIDFPLLLEFLESNVGFRQFLKARGMAWQREPGRFDYNQLAHILMSPDADTPDELLDALYFVDNLSNPDCFDRILQECQEAGIDLDGKNLSPEDLAIRAWLKDPNILERVHAEQYRAKPQRFESYFANQANRPDLIYPANKVLAALDADMNEWFDFKKKGRGARTFVFSREDGVWFLVRHGQRIKREGTVEADESSGSVFYRPEKFDVLIYYPQNGELAINTETKGERRAYCQFFGKHLFGNPRFFRFDDPISKYTLAPLILRGRDSLACGDVLGLRQILLQELHIAHNSDQDDVEVRKAEDVFRALENQRRSLQNEEASVRLVKAKFRVTFSDGKERTIAVEPPNVASFDRESDNEIIHEWMSLRGFIQISGIQEYDDVEDRAVLAVH